jgi:hypothetical protein
MGFLVQHPHYNGASYRPHRRPDLVAVDRVRGKSRTTTGSKHLEVDVEQGNVEKARSNLTNRRVWKRWAKMVVSQTSQMDFYTFSITLSCILPNSKLGPRNWQPDCALHADCRTRFMAISNHTPAQLVCVVEEYPSAMENLWDLSSPLFVWLNECWRYVGVALSGELAIILCVSHP